MKTCRVRPHNPPIAKKSRGLSAIAWSLGLVFLLLSSENSSADALVINCNITGDYSVMICCQLRKVEHKLPIIQERHKL